MDHISEYRDVVTARIRAAVDEGAARFTLPGDAEHMVEFIAPARSLLDGGKRTRAMLVAAGWRAVTHDPLPVHAGAAVELYQVSALVHDDLIDESPTRRGVAAAHKAFEESHVAENYSGKAAAYGEKSSVLLGDYLLSLAAVEIELAEYRDFESGARGRRIFHEMTAETAFGQFLDTRAEFVPLNDDGDAALADALAVVRHKSARYSVEVPLMLGAALAGADDDMLAKLSAIGQPLGEAFQLRDDELGIFGNPDVTGKPAGGDIAEGKRTALHALTRSLNTGADLELVDDVHGRELSAAEIAEVRRLVVDSGAYLAHEAMIFERENAAREALRSANLLDSTILDSVMERLSARRS